MINQFKKELNITRLMLLSAIARLDAAKHEANVYANAMQTSPDLTFNKWLFSTHVGLAKTP